MDFYKKTLSPTSVEYGFTLPIWLAVVAAIALLIAVVLILTLFFISWMSARRHEAAD